MDESPDLPEFSVGISVGADVGGILNVGRSVGRILDAVDPSVTALVWVMVDADVALIMYPLFDSILLSFYLTGAWFLSLGHGDVAYHRFLFVVVIGRRRR
jgi:hypothetical protein